MYIYITHITRNLYFGMLIGYVDSHPQKCKIVQREYKLRHLNIF